MRSFAEALGTAFLSTTGEDIQEEGLRLGEFSGVTKT